MSASSNSERPRRIGRLTLFEPVDAARPDAAWVGREDERVALVAVDRVPNARRFHRVRIQSLTHPGIESLLERREEDEGWVQLRELVLGVTVAELLDALVRRGERLPLSLVRGWITTLVDALVFLEQAEADGAALRLRHGALGLSTVRITFGGALRACDHELVRLFDPGSTELSSADALRGDVEGVAQLLTAMVFAPELDGDRERADLPLALAEDLERWRRAGVDAVASFAEFAARLRPRLAELPPPPDETDAAAWLRDRVPEAERATLARLRRIRAAGAKAEATEPSDPDRPALTVRELVRLGEPFEPSVITMPGEQVTHRAGLPEPETSAAEAPEDERPTQPRHVRSNPRSVPGSRSPARTLAAAAGLAALVAGGWWLGGRFARPPEDGPRVRVEAAPPPPGAPMPAEVTRPDPGPEAGSARGSGSAPSSALEPGRAPAVDRTRPDTAPEPAASVAARRVESGSGRRLDAARSEVRRGPRPRRSSAAGDPGNAPAPAAPELRRRLAAAEAAPNDPQAFQAVLDALRARLDALEPAADGPGVRRARAAIRRAELAWRVEALRRAVLRVEALE